MRLNSKVTLLLLLSTICILTLLPFLGLTDFHTKGEPREAIVAVSMLQSDNWVLPINCHIPFLRTQKKQQLSFPHSAPFFILF